MKQLMFTVTNDLNFDQRMIRICSALTKEGYETILIGRLKKNSQLLVNQPFKQKRLSIFFERGFLFYAEFNLRLFFFLLFKKADLICSVDLDTLPAGWLAARLSGKKITYDAHEYFSEVPELVERPIIKKVWEFIADFFVPKTDGAYTVGEGLKGIFEEKFGIEFEVIRNMPVTGDGRRITVNGERRTANGGRGTGDGRRVTGDGSQRYDLKKEKDETFKLFYQGALNDGRGLEEMIQAMTGLPNCELHLAGEGDLSGKLRQLVKDFGVEDRVRFLGWVLPRDLKKLTLEADIGLNLLKNKGLNYYYSLANKFFDYARAGVPSVNMQFPEYAALAKEFETAVLIPDLKKATIIKAVQQLIENPVKYERLRANCKLAAEVWNWENESEKLINFYKKILRNGKST